MRRSQASPDLGLTIACGRIYCCHNMKHFLSPDAQLKLTGHKAGRIALHTLLAVERADYRQAAMAGILREFRLNLFTFYKVAFALTWLLAR